MKRRIITLILLIASAPIAGAQVYATDTDSRQIAKANGLTPQGCTAPRTDTLSVQSAVLHEGRLVSARLPRPYCDVQQKFAVVYLLDADLYMDLFTSITGFLADNDRIPPVIVVGIAQRDRTHELTPTASFGLKADGTPSLLPTSGGGPDFRRFIATELIPAIEMRYRTGPFRVLAGHSFGGLFVLDTLLSDPGLFRAYIAASPSVWWDHELETSRLIGAFDPGRSPAARLYMSIANESDISQDAFYRFRSVLMARSGATLTWTSDTYDDEEHVSSVLMAFYRGMRKVFEGWPIPRDHNYKLPLGGVAGLETWYVHRSQMLGQDMPLTEQALNALAAQQFYAGKLRDRVKTYARAIELFPKSADMYDRLGDALVTVGELEKPG